MTEEEKSKLRQLKADVADELQRQRYFYEKKYRYALADTDGRIGGYVFSVIDNPEAHNLYELLKVRRFSVCSTVGIGTSGVSRSLSSFTRCCASAARPGVGVTS